MQEVVSKYLISWRCPASSRLVLQWGGEPEGRTMPWRTHDAYLPGVLLGNHTADVESQTQTRADARLLFDPWYAVKALPDALIS